MSQMFRNSYTVFQRGGALVVAIFIIVVMSVLGIALVSVLRDTSKGIVTEVYGTRAYNAAVSGVQIFMAEQLFPNSGNAPNCAAQNYTYVAPGLANCSATVSCNAFVLPSPYIGEHYRVISTSTCTVGQERYSRRILVEALNEQ